jgi:hypothetical protein
MTDFLYSCLCVRLVPFRWIEICGTWLQRVKLPVIWPITTYCQIQTFRRIAGTIFFAGGVWNRASGSLLRKHLELSVFFGLQPFCRSPFRTKKKIRTNLNPTVNARFHPKTACRENFIRPLLNSKFLDFMALKALTKKVYKFIRDAFKGWSVNYGIN